MATKHGWLPGHLLITPLLVDEQGVLVCQFSIELLQLTAQGKKNKLLYRNCDPRFPSIDSYEQLPGFTLGGCLWWWEARGGGLLNIPVSLKNIFSSCKGDLTLQIASLRGPKIPDIIWGACPQIPPKTTLLQLPPSNSN